MHSSSSIRSEQSPKATQMSSIAFKYKHIKNKAKLQDQIFVYGHSHACTDKWESASEKLIN